ASAALAKEHLDVIRAQIDGRLDLRLVLGTPTWIVEGDAIRGAVTISETKLRIIMGFARDFVQDLAAGRGKPDKKPEGGAKPPPSTPSRPPGPSASGASSGAATNP